MIKYNHRYRGPFEYDKYVLSTLSLVNAISLIELDELVEATEDYASLTAINEQLNELYNNLLDLDLSLLNKFRLVEEEY